MSIKDAKQNLKQKSTGYLFLKQKKALGFTQEKKCPQTREIPSKI